MDFKRTIKSGIKNFGIDLTKEQVELFEVYRKILQEYGEKINITKLLSDEDIAVKHILDSLAVLQVIGKPSGKWIDVGTGAGMPLLPMKILFPEIEAVFLDSKNKSIKFMDKVIAELKLTGCRTIWGRAEEVVRENKYFEKFDFVVIRAVGSLDELIKYALPFLKIGGKFLAYKGKMNLEEINIAKPSIMRIGGILEDIRSVRVPHLDAERHIVIIGKQANSLIA